MTCPDNSTIAPAANWFERLRTTPNYRLTALIVASAMFMEQVDATVLATALPTMARDYHAPVVNLSSAITAYLLALAIFIPVSGRLVDRLGARTVFRGAVLIFMGSSVLCAFAPTIGWLTAARFLQGMGGAIMVPVGRLVLLRVAPKDQLVTATAWLITPVLIGPIIGPPLGGLIVTHLDWRWIFYLNLPMGALGVTLISLFIDNGRSGERHPLDFIGFLLSAVSLGCLLFGFESVSRAGEGLKAGLLISAGLAIALFYVAHARRVTHPVLDLTLLRDQSFRLSMMAGSLTRITQGAQTFLTPLLFQVGLGMNAAASGALILSIAVGAMLAKTITTQTLRRFGFRNSMIVNGLATSALYATCGLFRADWPTPVIIIVLGLSGFFMSMQFSAYNSIAFETIEPQRLSTASSFYFTFQQVLLSLGVCMGAIALHGGMIVGRHAEPRPLDFTVAFAIVCGITVTAVFVHRAFPANAGAALTRPRVAPERGAAAQ